MEPARLTVVAEFPRNYFLENLAVRQDGSIMVTALTQRELWCVPAPLGPLPVEPALIHTFDHPALGIVEVDPDIFYVSTSEVYTASDSQLWRIDMTRKDSHEPIAPELVLDLEGAGGLNGSCLIGARTLLLADSVAGLIWRIDLTPDGRGGDARVWLADESMALDPNSSLLPPQPGINGIRFARRGRFVVYSSTAKRLLMRVPLDGATLDPAGRAEVVDTGRMSDDLCLDEDSHIAYVATHRENTIDRVRLDDRSPRRSVVAGEPFDPILVGPSSIAWGRRRGDYGRIAYVITDGGTTSPPPDGLVRPALLLRLSLDLNHEEQ